jgi:tagatose 6-phosphate kinase
VIICLGVTPAIQRVMSFDGLVIDEVNRAVETSESVAGKSINVAKVLAALGEEVVATGFVGGERGEALRQELDRREIRHDFVTVDARTRMCVTVMDRAAGTVTELVEESRPVEPAAYERLTGKLRTLLGGARMLVLSGTLTPGGPSDYYRTCIELARGHGVGVLLDTQKRPLLEALGARPTLVKPNRAELAAALGVAIDSERALREAMGEVIRRGAESVVITMGREGAMGLHEGRFWRVSAPAIDAVNPIGSGDAFSAGLAAAMVHGRDFTDSLRWGAACGASNALTALAGEVRAEDVQRLIGQVQVEPA